MFVFCFASQVLIIMQLTRFHKIQGFNFEKKKKKKEKDHKKKKKKKEKDHKKKKKKKKKKRKTLKKPCENILGKETLN